MTTAAGAGTRGVVFVHSCARALTKHVEWAVAGVLGGHVALEWIPQPCQPGQVRADLPWHGPVGTAARLVSQLRRWPGLRLEVTEEPTAAGPGERFALTPDLGLFRAEIGPHGDVVLGEDRVRSLITASRLAPHALSDALLVALGEPWDRELEPYRASVEQVGMRHLRVM